MDAASASIPTGPPLNLYIIDFNKLWSVSSSPSESTFNLSNDFLVISSVIVPRPSTKAKSLTLFKRRLAILGVPLALLASSTAAASSIPTSNTSAVLLIILHKSSIV